MSKRGENIYKRLDGRWEGRYAESKDPITGKKKYHSIYGKSYGETKQKLLTARQKVTETNNTNTAKDVYVLENWLHIWLYQYANLNVKETTFSNYYFCIQKHILPNLGRKNINKITTYDLQLFYNEKLLDGRLDGAGGLSPKSVKDLHTILSTSFRQAFCNNLIDKNPCVNIKIPTDKYTTIRVLTVDEQRILESAIRNSDHYLALPIMLALYSGLRIGEVCALQWKDVDLSSGIIRVTSSLQRVQVVPNNGIGKTKMIISTPKSTASIREIPMPTCLIEYLTKKKKELLHQGFLSLYVVCNCEGNYVDPRTLQYYFTNLINQLAIPSASFHTLRHTFATRAIEVGVDIKSLSEILGHADVSITLKKYVHSLIDHKRSQMQKMNLIF